ncbi:MAG: hypothetical protein LUC44_09185 [Prevotellaceae bacterium]|nr:hypothetical protein [Prevotellaceae bacterium]
MAILYSLSRKKMPFDDEKSGKIYATAQNSGVVKTEALAREVAQMSCMIDKYSVLTVIDLLAKCIRMRLLDGKRVELGELGDFYTVLKSEGSDQEKNYAESKIKDVRVKWEPGKHFCDLMCHAKFHRVTTRKSQHLTKIRDKQAVQEELDAANAAKR